MVEYIHLVRTMTTILIRLPKRFKDIQIERRELKLITKFDEFGNRVMEGEIVKTPLKYDCPCEEGDTIYFHHHVVIDNRNLLRG